MGLGRKELLMKKKLIINYDISSTNCEDPPENIKEDFIAEVEEAIFRDIQCGILVGNILLKKDGITYDGWWNIERSDVE